MVRIVSWGVPGVIASLWLLWGAYWAIASIGRKPARRIESPLGRLAHLAAMGLAFLLLTSHRWAALDAHLWPHSATLEAVAVFLTVLGLAFSVWARVTLGKNWSAVVTIREDHALIRSGPYRWVRHPIYTGMLTALAGAVIGIGEVRALAAFLILAVGFTLKAKKEESFLAQEFGPAFEEHKRRTGFFVPRFRSG